MRKYVYEIVFSALGMFLGAAVLFILPFFIFADLYDSGTPGGGIPYVMVWTGCPFAAIAGMILGSGLGRRIDRKLAERRPK